MAGPYIEGTGMNKIVLLLLMMFLAAPGYAYPAEQAEPELVFERTIFEYRGGVVDAPMARPASLVRSKDLDGTVPGWVQPGPGGYIAFDAGDVFFPEEGTIDIRLVVLDPDGLTRIGNDLESLVSLYDEAGAPLFSVGINDHDIMVGSYELHPMLMEDVFGGVGFPYVDKLGGPPKKGADISVAVTWGKKPSENRVYVNGKFIEAAIRKGPKHYGKPPGFEPVARLASFMYGFGVFDGRVVGPPVTLTIGKVGGHDPDNPLSMYPPTSVGIKSVRCWNSVTPP